MQPSGSTIASHDVRERSEVGLVFWGRLGGAGVLEEGADGDGFWGVGGWRG